MSKKVLVVSTEANAVLRNGFANSLKQKNDFDARVTSYIEASSATFKEVYILLDKDQNKAPQDHALFSTAISELRARRPDMKTQFVFVTDDEKIQTQAREQGFDAKSCNEAGYTPADTSAEPKPNIWANAFPNFRESPIKSDNILVVGRGNSANQRSAYAQSLSQKGQEARVATEIAPDAHLIKGGNRLPYDRIYIFLDPMNIHTQTEYGIFSAQAKQLLAECAQEKKPEIYFVGRDEDVLKQAASEGFKTVSLSLLRDVSPAR